MHMKSTFIPLFIFIPLKPTFVEHVNNGTVLSFHYFYLQLNGCAHLDIETKPK